MHKIRWGLIFDFWTRDRAQPQGAVCPRAEELLLNAVVKFHMELNASHVFDVWVPIGNSTKDVHMVGPLLCTISSRNFVIEGCILLEWFI